MADQRGQRQEDTLPERPAQPQPSQNQHDTNAGPDEAQPAEEWGQRQEAGKAIERGGQTQGHVPGADDKT